VNARLPGHGSAAPATTAAPAASTAATAAAPATPAVAAAAAAAPFAPAAAPAHRHIVALHHRAPERGGNTANADVITTNDAAGGGGGGGGGGGSGTGVAELVEMRADVPEPFLLAGVEHRHLGREPLDRAHEFGIGSAGAVAGHV
jgi:hypothetical protein